MELYHVPFHPNNSHIRCLAHVVNLVVQKMLSIAKDIDDPEFQDYYEQLNKQFPIHYDLDNDEELCDFENEKDDGSKVQTDLGDGLVDQECGEQDHFSEMGTIEKVSLMRSILSIFVKIVSTPGCRQLFRKKAKWVITHVAMLMPVRDAIDAWLFEFEELCGLLLSSREWDILGQYEDLLECFTEVTAVISHSSMPTLPWFLPMYELMHEHLVMFMDDAEWPLAIREAACAGNEKLMQYYKIARESMHVIVATACHPTLRMNWFLKLGENSHTHALTVFRHVYEEYASNMSPVEDQPTTHGGADSDSDNGILGSAAARPVIEETHLHTESQSEFARWVANEGGHGKMHYPLIWWKVCHCNLILTGTCELTLVLHSKLTQQSSLSLHKWQKTFSQSWGHWSLWRDFFQVCDTFAETRDHHSRLIQYQTFC
ncbi:hypothetical protein EI94DRAFT_1629243 [Lactarius quietus]|nr:hypothetical protein EI94DRAFT_1629243 [Lactarius quietus]